jgi:hypothetical protein
MKNIFVVAPKGKVCAKEMSRENIDDSIAQEVPENLYYRRRIAEGSLLIFRDDPKDKKRGGLK